jgi:hypothetical protein
MTIEMTPHCSRIVAFALLAGLIVACRTKADPEPARKALAEDVKIACAPALERDAPPGGLDVNEADAYAALARIIGAETTQCDRGDAGPCAPLLERTDADVRTLRASLRSKHATLANVLRFPNLDATPLEDAPTTAKQNTRLTGIARFVKVMRVRLDHELSPSPSDEAIRVCTDLAIFVRDMWRVGDLTAITTSSLGVVVLSAKCTATLDGSKPEERRALADTLREIRGVSFADMMKNEWAESRLVSGGGLMPDSLLTCETARTLARRMPPPLTDEETQRLVTIVMEDSRAIDANMSDPTHEPLTAKYATKIDEMKADLADLATKAAAPPRKRKSATPPLPPSAPSAQVGSVLNPRSAHGEWIYTRADGSCYYATIANAPSNSPVDPWRNIVVDCPTDLDDPAYDVCVDGRLEGTRGAAKCSCLTRAGQTLTAPCPR